MNATEKTMNALRPPKSKKNVISCVKKHNVPVLRRICGYFNHAAALPFIP